MELRDLSDFAPIDVVDQTEEVAESHDVPEAEILTLSTNENPIGPSPAAAAVARDLSESLHEYPLGTERFLAGKLGSRWGISPDQVWIANGGYGVIEHLSRVVLRHGEEVLTNECGFGYLGRAARYQFGSVDTYRESDPEAFRTVSETILDRYSGQRIVYLISPHNPTGADVPTSEIERIDAETGDETLTVVDETYQAFSDSSSAIDLVSDTDTIAVLRSFSKLHGLAGLRLSYAVVPRAWATAYDRIKTPFATSEVAYRAGAAALDDADHVERVQELVRWGRSYLHEELDVRTWESSTNFVLADVGGDASAVVNRAKQRKLLVRDCASFGLPECIRISCGTRSETRRAVEILNELVE